MPTFSTTDVDRFLKSVLGQDSLLQSYCPGGFWSSDPPQGSVFPVARWWQQSAGTDVIRQDGAMGRVVSQPKFVCGILDNQQALDWLDGTSGISEGYELGVKRIYDLIHGQTVLLNGFTYLSYVISAAPRSTDSTNQGTVRPFQGWFVQFLVQ
jgi:hypothetical protein